MPDFGSSERRILSYFHCGEKIFYKNQEYVIVEADKPSCPHGEPKADIYVLVENRINREEIKISYKKHNADFLENKTNAERAEQLLGSEWRNVIAQSTKSLRRKFENKCRIYKDAFGRTEKGSITLGWKFELMNKPAGELSGKMDLTEQQVYDVYAGANLSAEKRNALINGRPVLNSGIAEYILVGDEAQNAQEVIDYMISIDKYIEKYPDVYFACKALNYRTFKRKYDGNRPLAVQVGWYIEDGKLLSELIFNRPLELNGNEMAHRLCLYLKQLHISTTDDIREDNADMEYVYRHQDV